MKIAVYLILFFFSVSQLSAQNKQRTYCNPVNIDYGYTPIPNFSEWGRHRATADPVIVTYKGDYYLFSTNQWGYWWSSDMLNWKFISKLFLRSWNKVYDELCAPAIGVIGDTMIVFGSTYTKNFTIWMSTDPKNNVWKPLVDSFEIGGWDPAFFTDDDARLPARAGTDEKDSVGQGKLYMYNGSSNRYPTYGIELNRKTFQPIGTRTEMYLLEPERYGWQRFGEYLDNTFLDPFIEGAWMTKHNGKYYFQYGAPGTEFSGYADGVIVGTNPLGPFVPQPDPLSWKAGGFARGAGHGATYQDKYNNWWHVSTIAIGIKNSFERRIGIWPAGFDKDDVMYCNTAFGDYPHYLPAPTNSPEGGELQPHKGLLNQSNLKSSDSLKNKNLSVGKASPTGGGLERAGTFTGWMLLNYNIPVTVSSTLGSYNANFSVDESIKTYWSAASGNKGEWLQTDLGNTSTVNAIQINYADQDVDSSFLGKTLGKFHQYKIYSSLNGEKWNTLIDKSNNKTDIPHDYVELQKPVQARFLKLENIHMPTGKFAISGFRVFGKGNGSKPDTVKQFAILRTEKDKRSAWLKWSPVDNAYAYNIYMGVASDKLYNCIMIYNANEYYYKGMDKERAYYFQIESINENGVSERTKVKKIE